MELFKRIKHHAPSIVVELNFYTQFVHIVRSQHINIVTFSCL